MIKKLKEYIKKLILWSQLGHGLYNLLMFGDATTDHDYEVTPFKVHIPSGLGITRIGSYNFAYNEGLTEIILPDELKTIYDSTFDGCSGLTSLTLPNTITSLGSSVFSGCSGLTSLTLPNTITSLGNYCFQNCSGLTSLTLSTGLTSLPAAAFNLCRALTTITIPSNILTINARAFSNCAKLEEIIINKVEGSIAGAPWGATNATIIWNG